MSEIWKPIPGYEGLYKVSNRGRVRSLDRIDPRRGGYHKRGQILKQSKAGKGYLFVGLSRGGLVTPVYVHRLVAQTFIGSIPPKFEINHKDADKQNNEVSNLEIVRHKKNIHHAMEKGLTPTLGKPGDLNHKAVLDWKAVKRIRAAYRQGKRQSVLAEEFSVCRQTINNIVHNKSWR